MEIRSESGLVIKQRVDIDFENPDQSFIFPRFTRLNRWLRTKQFDSVKVVLKFEQAFYVFTELTHDDRDSGLFKNFYIDCLVLLPSSRKVEWNKSIPLASRNLLRPVPDDMYQYLQDQSLVTKVDYKSLTDGFLHHVSDDSQFRIYTNENYNIFSSFGEDEEEFARSCNDFASLEKSEQSLKLAIVVDRELQQNIAGMRDASRHRTTDKAEIVSAQLENFELSCKRMINKAVSLHTLEQIPNEISKNRTEHYQTTLEKEIETIADALEGFKEDFLAFSKDFVRRFTEIEEAGNIRAQAIQPLNIPPSSSSLELLRIAQVWLPHWSVRFEVDGAQKDQKIKAF